MNVLATKLTTLLLGAGKLMAEEVTDLDPKFQWVQNIVDAIDTLLYPLLVIVGAAGMIYAVVLGVQMARADSTEKREEAKKHAGMHFLDK